MGHQLIPDRCSFEARCNGSCKAQECLIRQREKRSPSPSYSHTSSASDAWSSGLPATIVIAARPPTSFGDKQRKSSSTSPAARRYELSVGPPSHRIERTPWLS